MLVDRNLRRRVEFHQAYPTPPLPPFGASDFVFLPNVMIYFNDDTKGRVVRNLLSLLKQDRKPDALRQPSPAIHVKK